MLAGDKPLREPHGLELATAAEWPFQRDILPPGAPAAVGIRNLHLAFPAGQTSGTRLVLTQSTYQLQRWIDWLDATPGAVVVADADRASLARSSPEAFAGRGPWSRITVTGSDATPDANELRGRQDDAAPLPGHVSADEDPASTARRALHDAFTQPDPRHRLEACHAALDAADDAAFYLAFASTCMELQLLDAARAAVDEAETLAPGWEAVHFERGKLLLRLEQTEAATEAFAEAARLMPTFAAALLNLGGALGELGRRTEARSALERALVADPRSHTALNNLGAVCREDGRLDEAAAAFRRVIDLAPSFVFGYYNLGQTLLLAGEVRAARRAYEEGFGRDPQKNPRQATRLAVARAADGDAQAAVDLLDMLARALPADKAVDLFAEVESSLEALAAGTDVDRAAVDRLLAVIRDYSS